ncbi:ATP-binding protein [Pedobacter miscanthi]|uniref:ATP-binding protein n=1 Tax=Pedobacter miscanthi TaxID=2259170 RepID=UPI00292D6912|nr:ATP-binding protein [Pedobacter miscanthi]
MALEDAVPELRGQPFKKMLQQVLRTGIDNRGVIPATTKVDGHLQTSYYEYWYRAIKDSDGQPYAIMHTAKDVTDQLNNKQALEAAEVAAEIQRERLYSFFMQAPAGICIFDGPELTFELVNPLYQALFPGRELLGKKVLDAIPEINGQPVWDILQQVYDTGNTFEGNSLLIPLARTSEGAVEERYFNFIYQARKGFDGKVDGIMVFVFEVTDMVNVQHDLQKAEGLITLAIEASEIGIWTKDLLTDRLIITPRTRAIHGLHDNQEITLSQATQMITDEHRERVENSIRYAIENKESFMEQYWIQPVDGGKARWLRSNGKAHYNESGEALYVSGTIADLTEQKEDDNRKNDFIGMVSHELKTPLTSLNAIIQLAQYKLKDYPDQFLAGAMDKAAIQAKRMSNMINGFLNISRLESGKIQLILTQFNLETLLEEVITETRLIVSTHQIKFEFTAALQLYADREKIGSVIANLLGNAVKYSPAGTAISIKCEKVDQNVIISVTDEGMGLKKQDTEKIFDRYFRVESNDTKNIAGFGIGLYLSAEIIHLHQGKIWVESEFGKGSVFYFSLPLTLQTD